MNKSVLPHAKQKLSSSSQHGGEGDSLSMTRQTIRWIPKTSYYEDNTETSGRSGK
ncbi:hypothetical protein GTCCBUS3UF5_32540 [Geobacillus thermoleovorans CCB_US3_UF5]|nr:hypothetical protein [Geobacillus sp. ZGt-1]AEV20556.1 hypothetical protein GTCCBUS3UF5_32540 [Geobacillus thermoleovorans CCB_US3_UF5]GAJ57691.1 hypothetical protein B23_0897 [Geobacillus thermoleovorans B23]